MITRILSWIAGVAVDSVLDEIDRKESAGVEREKAKGQVLTEFYRSRPAFMRAGGFYLMAVFVFPLGFWWASVCVYSVLWCADCAYPQPWTVAALPPPLNTWAGWIVMFLFVADRFRR